MKAVRGLNVLWFGLAAVLPVAVLAGCTAVAQPDASASTAAPPATVSGVGELPGPAVATSDFAQPSSAVDPAATQPTDSVAADTSTSTTMAAVTTTTFVPIGLQAAGNRVLMIGDSVTASISQRYGGEGCAALVPLGWKLEVDAETGKFIDFGQLVLNKRLSAGWDAFIIFLGNNYGKNQPTYEKYLHDILDRLSPRPVVLITTALFRPEQKEVNDVIRLEQAKFANITVLDWTTVAAEPTLTGLDGLHLTDIGRRALAFQLAATLGRASAEPGACLKTSFTDDSAGSPNGPPGNTTTPKPKPTATTSPSGTTAPSTGATVTTVPFVEPTVTTAKPTGTTQTPVPTTTSTAPPTTPPPSTTPPSTAAPTTAATAAPTTAAQPVTSG